MQRLTCAVWCCSFAACLAGGAGPPQTTATSLTVVDPAFQRAEVLVAMSMPPQFDVMLERNMPSTGWSLLVDAIEVDTGSGRIVARISEIAPTGAAAQMITATSCRLGLGKLSPGSYVL